MLGVQIDTHNRENQVVHMTALHQIVCRQANAYIWALPAAQSTREDELKQRIQRAQPVYPWR